MASRISSGSLRTARTPPNTSAHRVTTTSAGVRPDRNPATTRADTTNVAAFTANAAPTPKRAITIPTVGASAIWPITAALHSALFAVTTSCSPTISGNSEDAAGLKTTAPAARPNATAYANPTESVENTSAAANAARVRSAPTISRRRDSRSAASPATGPSSSTASTSSTTTPATPTPELVRSNTSTTNATVLNASPARDTE